MGAKASLQKRCDIFFAKTYVNLSALNCAWNVYFRFIVEVVIVFYIGRNMYPYKFDVCEQTDQAKLPRLLKKPIFLIVFCQYFADNFNNIQLYFHLRTTLVSLFA